MVERVVSYFGWTKTDVKVGNADVVIPPILVFIIKNTTAVCECAWPTKCLLLVNRHLLGIKSYSMLKMQNKPERQSSFNCAKFHF